MTYSHKVQHTITAVGVNVTDDNTYTAPMFTGLDETITGGGNQTFTNFDVDVSQVESLVMLCDRDITITVNDDGTPDATIALKAGKVLRWAPDGYFTNPLGSTDVASIKATLAAGADASLRIEVLQTPV